MAVSPTEERGPGHHDRLGDGPKVPWWPCRVRQRQGAKRLKPGRVETRPGKTYKKRWKDPPFLMGKRWKITIFDGKTMERSTIFIAG